MQDQQVIFVHFVLHLIVILISVNLIDLCYWFVFCRENIRVCYVLIVFVIVVLADKVYGRKM